MTNKKIEELFGQVPYFADQIIEKAMPHQLQEDFVVKKTWYTYGSVNLLQVRDIHFNNDKSSSILPLTRNR